MDNGYAACHVLQGRMRVHKDMMANNEQCCCMIAIFSRCNLCFIAGALKLPNGGDCAGESCEEEEPGAVDSEHDSPESRIISP